jgi:hypothetical protein
MSFNYVTANSFVESKEPAKVAQHQYAVTVALGGLTMFFPSKDWTLDEVIDLFGTLHDDLCGLRMEAQVKAS